MCAKMTSIFLGLVTCEDFSNNSIQAQVEEKEYVVPATDECSLWKQFSKFNIYIYGI